MNPHRLRSRRFNQKKKEQRTDVILQSQQTRLAPLSARPALVSDVVRVWRIQTTLDFLRLALSNQTQVFPTLLLPRGTSSDAEAVDRCTS